jgi:hypothetical protein
MGCSEINTEEFGRKKGIVQRIKDFALSIIYKMIIDVQQFYFANYQLN